VFSVDKKIAFILIFILFFATSYGKEDSYSSKQTLNKHDYELKVISDRIKAEETFLLKFVSTDPHLALKRSLEAQEIDPKNLVWYQVIEMIFAIDAYQGKSMDKETRKTHYTDTLNYLQVSLKNLKHALHPPLSPDEKNILMKIELDTAIASVEAGNLLEAKKLATDALNNNTDTNSWNYANIINTANTVLGRVALREKNIEEAKRYLLLSAETIGSPQLNSFGPSFILARELLQKKEKEAVLHYLDRITLFWTNSTTHSKNQKLKQWKQTILTDGIPEDTKWK
jgi:hypothetical protein